MHVRFSNIIYVKSAFKIHLNTLGILVRKYFHKFCFNNDYLTTAKISLKMPNSIAVCGKLRLLMPKTNKKDKI